MHDKYLNAVVLSRHALTPRITEFRLGLPDGGALPVAEAGSHIELLFGDQSGRFLRHYSLVGPLDADRGPEGFWRIAVQREDRARGSAFLHNAVMAGAQIRVSRPINGFRLSRQPAHSLLIAGGIGITPILAMARSLTMRGRPFAMLYAGQARAGMAYVGDAEAICAGHLTIHESELSGIPDIAGLLAAQPADTVAYVCGPPAMIEAVRTAARGLGWSDDRVRFEVFNAAHRAEDGDFQVRLPAGRLITVGAGTTILDALEHAGVDTLSSCRRGECGLCVTDVVDCDGALDHRDRFLSEDDRRAMAQMTICCSRITGRVVELNI